MCVCVCVCVCARAWVYWHQSIHPEIQAASLLWIVPCLSHSLQCVKLMNGGVILLHTNAQGCRDLLTSVG